MQRLVAMTMLGTQLATAGGGDHNLIHDQWTELLDEVECQRGSPVLFGVQQADRRIQPCRA